MSAKHESFGEGNENKEVIEGELDQLVGRVSQSHLEVSKFAAEHPGQKEPAVLRERLGTLARRMKEAISMAVILGTVALGVRHVADLEDVYNATRYQVRETTDSKGNLVFEHADPETTQIISYLSGKADLPEEIKRRTNLVFIKEFAGKLKFELPADCDKMSERQLSDLFDRIIGVKLGPQYAHGDLERRFFRYGENQELYNALWKIEKEAGNPRIRFMEKSEPSKERVIFFEHRGAYESLVNTMYIDNGFPVKSFVAEAAHGQQFGRSFLAAELSFELETYLAKLDAFIERRPLQEAYDWMEYDTPGTIEYEAHREIEPELKKELPQDKHLPGL